MTATVITAMQGRTTATAIVLSGSLPEINTFIDLHVQSSMHNAKYNEHLYIWLPLATIKSYIHGLTKYIKPLLTTYSALEIISEYKFIHVSQRAFTRRTFPPNFVPIRFEAAEP